jgi:hypothetical protein
MPKLNSVKRGYAIQDIRSGSTNKELITKYGVTASAVCYLRKIASGTTPLVSNFEESLGAYCPARILRLAKEEGLSPKELAEDYEVTTSVMKAYLNKVWPLTEREKLSKGAKIKVRGQNKAVTKSRKKK